MVIVVLVGLWFMVSLMLVTAWSVYRRSFASHSLEHYDQQVRHVPAGTA